MSCFNILAPIWKAILLQERVVANPIAPLLPLLPVPTIHDGLFNPIFSGSLASWLQWAAVYSRAECRLPGVACGPILS